MPTEPGYRAGLLVAHPQRPEWGPGRVLSVDGTKITVYFRDLPGDHPEAAVRTIETKYVSLAVAPNQSDPFLENLPPFAHGRFERPLRRRVTLREGIDLFGSLYPLYFEDPGYLRDVEGGEREYKWRAHERFVSSLGGGQLTVLLAAGELAEIRRRVLAVEGGLNLLAVFEKAALRDGLADDSGALRLFSALHRVLDAPGVDPSGFEAYVAAVESLPSKEGMTSPAKWPVATILPFVADPERFMFLKPGVTQQCAERLTFDLAYRPQPNWTTYARLLEMAQILLVELRPYGARDFIDVQSFIWRIGDDRR